MESIGVGDLVELVESVPKKDLHKGSLLSTISMCSTYFMRIVLCVQNLAHSIVLSLGLLREIFDILIHEHA